MARAACPVRWKLSDVKREIKILEPLANAQSRAAYVLMKLRGRWAVPQECEMVLLQGYVLHLHSLGFGVVLHKASASAIRATIFNSAKSQFLQQVAKAKKAGHKMVDMPFKPHGASTPHTLARMVNAPLILAPTDVHRFDRPLERLPGRRRLFMRPLRHGVLFGPARDHGQLCGVPTVGCIRLLAQAGSRPGHPCSSRHTERQRSSSNCVDARPHRGGEFLDVRCRFRRREALSREQPQQHRWRVAVSAPVH